MEAMTPKIDGAALLDAVVNRVAAEKDAKKANERLAHAKKQEKLRPLYDSLKDAFERRIVTEHYCGKSGRMTVRLDDGIEDDGSLSHYGPQVVIDSISHYSGMDRHEWANIRFEFPKKDEREFSEPGFALYYSGTDSHKAKTRSPDMVQIMTTIFERLLCPFSTSFKVELPTGFKVEVPQPVAPAPAPASARRKRK